MKTTDGLRVGIAELRRHPGTQRELSVTAVVPDLELSASRVPAGEPIVVEAVLESLSEGLTATGTVTVPWVGECRRCLNEVRGVETASFREVFEIVPVDGETYPLDGDHVDLEPMIRDVVLLTLPLAPLCRDDCAGPDPERFPAAAVLDEPESDGGQEPAPDPRWAALDQLKFD